jgi:hypothetical protein
MPSDGRTPVYTPEFADAIRDFTPNDNTPDCTFESFGEFGDVLRLAYTVLDAVAYTRDFTKKILEILDHHLPDVGQALLAQMPAQSSSSATAFAKLMETDFFEQLFQNQNTFAAFCQFLRCRYKEVESARSNFELLHSRIDAHLAKRAASSQCWLTDIPHDAMQMVVQQLSATSSHIALLASCKTFSTSKLIQEKLPHLSIRRVLGSFPHANVPVAVGGESTLVSRDFVIARNVIKLYVDFCTIDAIKNLPASAASNPDALLAPQQQPNPFREGTFHWQKFEDISRARCQKWEQLKGPPETAVAQDVYKRRVSYEHYFDKPLSLKAVLVYADDLTVVGESSVQVSAAVLKSNGFFQQTRHRGCAHLPACAKFHVTALSSRHGNRLFRLKVTGTGSLLESRGGGSKTLVAFSDQFETDSRGCVVQSARKRTLSVSRDAKGCFKKRAMSEL